MKRSYRMVTICVLAGAMPAAWGQSPNANPRALEVSQAYLRANGAALGLTNPAGELRSGSGRTDASGQAHIRYQQFYKDVKVFEGEAIAHVGPDGRAVTLTNAIKGNISLDVSPSVPRGAALSAAARYLGIQGSYTVAAEGLEILPRGDRSVVDVLTWHFTILVEGDGEIPGQWDAFVDAKTASVVWAFDSLQAAGKGKPGPTAATATGRTMYAGNVTLDVSKPNSSYSLVDPKRAGNETRTMKNGTKGSGTVMTSSTANFGNGLVNNSDQNTAGADVHFGMAVTWDYLLAKHGRNGIDGTGRMTYARVHYTTGYNGAFWNNSCFCATYGDGDASLYYPAVSLDAVGHEMAHGVMSSEANLTYSGESGGLNEANSDIFGTMVEFYAYELGVSTDVPEYWHGEGPRVADGEAAHYFEDPERDGKSKACWSETLKDLNVHFSSGPGNHMFYLLAEGGVSKCNGSDLTGQGIGREKAMKIWYDAITNRMTAGTNYAGAKVACMAAALALYGSAEEAAVAAAFSAIDVN